MARKRDPLRGTAAFALAVIEVINKHNNKKAKHLDLDIADATFSFTRKITEIAAEAPTDGIYVVRTSLPAEKVTHRLGRRDPLDRDVLHRHNVLGLANQCRVPARLEEPHRPSSPASSPLAISNLGCMPCTRVPSS